ncbi:MAG: hypothetical protein QOF90_735 [Acetobacteraceae bacterium]|nr:hypothetical protein [Acetobacteraceae bacterium]
MRSPRFRHVPFRRNGVSDHGRAVTPRISVHNVLPSTVTTVSASARLSLSRLNIPLHMIAVYASQPPSPATTQHSLGGGSLLPYPRRSSPAGPRQLRLAHCDHFLHVSSTYPGILHQPLDALHVPDIRAPLPSSRCIESLVGKCLLHQTGSGIAQRRAYCRELMETASCTRLRSVPSPYRRTIFTI